MSNLRINPREKLTKEPLLAQAVDVAREALSDVTSLKNVGEHAGLVQEGDRVVTHAFACLMPGYRGWYWTVTLARAARSKKVTVNELSLRPGPDALLAPEWVPWADRLRPGDIGVTDRLPYNPDDPHLVGVDAQAEADALRAAGELPAAGESVAGEAESSDFDSDLKQGYEAADCDADQAAQWELGLGRVRVLSESGKADAFRRWYRGEAGPKNQATREAKAHCATCGYFMKMAGSARRLFGVCANMWSPFDGRAVSVDHGCGAHSETDVKHREQLWVQSDPVVNEADIEVVARDSQGE
ncbi:MAG: DUF3027 domain-containing protein [Actinomycetaceae bacterium]|nr:DUF3027 domain-containing protein [Actinomycetaceae bacterium]MDY5854723.1 DUF3027 domain-containing protein [Arcanobacterium sp.]